MTDVAVAEALGESLSPSQGSTYITGSAKWCFRYLIGLISVFATEKNYSWKTSPLRQQLLTLHAQRPRPRLSSLAGCSGSFSEEFGRAGGDR